MMILNAALQGILHELNQYFRRMMPQGEVPVVLSNVMGIDGASFDSIQNKLVMCLANVAQESAVSSFPPGAGPGGGFLAVLPPLHLKLSVMLFANFGGGAYSSGLDLLSHAMMFLHSHPSMTSQNAPELDASIVRLRIELVSLSLQEQSHLLASMGLKYLPLAFYHVHVETLEQETAYHPHLELLEQETAYHPHLELLEQGPAA